MWCDWYDRGACSAPPYYLIGLTDANYIVYCEAHAEQAVARAAEYIGTHPGVDYDEEEETISALDRLKQLNIIEQHADLY